MWCTKLNLLSPVVCCDCGEGRKSYPGVVPDLVDSVPEHFLGLISQEQWKQTLEAFNVRLGDIMTKSDCIAVALCCAGGPCCFGGCCMSWYQSEARCGYLTKKAAVLNDVIAEICPKEGYNGNPPLQWSVRIARATLTHVPLPFPQPHSPHPTNRVLASGR